MNRRTYLALGSNLGDCHTNLQKGIQLISSRVGRIEAVSKFYSSAPLNPKEKPLLNTNDFLNAVVCCHTDLSSSDLLTELKAIEKDCGVDHNLKEHWGPRLLDLDIIAVAEEVVERPDLKIPHPEYQHRDFVLYPLREVAADFKDPVTGCSIDQMIAALKQSQKLLK